MSLGQVQLVRWSLPALALILGLLWYKRRRVDRVDPGGPTAPTSSPKADKASSVKLNAVEPVKPNTIPASAVKQCDSGIHSDDSLNTSGDSPVSSTSSLTPRKVSESLDIPGRSSSSLAQPSVSVAAFSQVPWYEDEEEVQEEEEVVKVEQNHSLLSKSRSSAELIANGIAMKESKREQKRQQRQAKIVVANGTPQLQEFDRTPDLVEASPLPPPVVDAVADDPPAVIEDQPLTNNKNHDKESQQPTDNESQTSSNSEQPASTTQNSQVLSERDSANHSPVSAVLEGSVTDEARSEGEGEGSTDSGNGGSINGGRSREDNSRTFYEFLIPTKLVGKLIGRGGRFLEHVRNEADVKLAVKRHQTDRDYQLCTIDGTPENITVALDIIRRHFPEKTYPYLTLEQIVYDEIVVPNEIAWMPELIQLSLVEGVNNDVFVCQIVTPNHFFIQLHTHPTYPSLRILTQRMTQEYNTVESPLVPEPLTKGMIVAAKFFDQWMRVCIEEPDPQKEQTLVRLVDHGGYYTCSNADMRSLRLDYLCLPFQAIEVYLANVQPKGEWTQEAFDVVSQLTSSRVGQAQIVGYDEFNTYINLYYNIHRLGFLSVAEELKARGLAVETPVIEEVISQEVLPTA
ncbi:KH domain-containing protein akap-1 [Copidosoma floridanum]|uniref:KH domain-containing protein akap-1 n=1 Tax=Copidosoma floridanum TaxID=29053 RepID=UPI0006C94019|nr:KH domain-containing protein akap-1 [Copidosoma floridanum]XP_014214043.1 KH domain-containing protein akap-1 [Copidosoma floridanum]XP_014214044.1 KH domain-containing protein akap-1 [Copidosoma floridanum]